MEIEKLLADMWGDYCALNPRAAHIHKLLTERGGKVENDHIALRTLRHPRLGIDHLARVFLEAGYVARGEYDFEAKKLYARHYEPPRDGLPKIFISELKIGEFSPALWQTMNDLADAASGHALAQDDVAMAGRLWDLSHETYLDLAEESEYAAWFAAFGFRPNHFTVLVNTLGAFSTLTELNAFLKESGYQLNASGGEIKGSPEKLLEQSSTIAEEVKVAFTDGVYEVPACYYEFARRYPQPDGGLYQGFVATSADKIFESTNAKR